MATVKPTLEHERKFLYTGGEHPSLLQDLQKVRLITQAYLPDTGAWGQRVRMTQRPPMPGEPQQPVTLQWELILKRRLEGCTNLELGTRLTLAEYMEWSAACGAPLCKQRHYVPHGGLVWHLDVFTNLRAPYAGLILCEAELPTPEHQLVLPAWAGQEVTEDPQYANGALVQHVEA